MRNTNAGSRRVIALHDEQEAREARAWVAGRLRFEELLADLERRPRGR